MLTTFFQDVSDFKSRRRYSLELKKRFGEWCSIRCDIPMNESKKLETFNWCKNLKHPWGCDETRRRFYFSNRDDAMLFKLTFKGI
jgi:hypothetical protein